MKPLVSIDGTQLETKVRRYLREIGKSTPEFVREQGRAMALNIHNGIAPFDQASKITKTTYGNKRDRLVGEKAVIDDITNCLVPKPRGFIDFLIFRFKGSPGRYELRSNKDGGTYVVDYDAITLEESEALAWHDKQRGPKGRVRRNAPKMWAPFEVVQAVVDHRLMRVGTAKASAAKAAMALGAKKPPRWIARHLGKVKGTGILVGKGRDRVSVVIKLSAYAFDTVSRRMGFLMNFRKHAMLKRAKFLARKAKQKSKL